MQYDSIYSSAVEGINAREPISILLMLRVLRAGIPQFSDIPQCVPISSLSKEESIHEYYTSYCYYHSSYEY